MNVELTDIKTGEARSLEVPRRITVLLSKKLSDGKTGTLVKTVGPGDVDWKAAVQRWALTNGCVAPQDLKIFHRPGGHEHDQSDHGDWADETNKEEAAAKRQADLIDKASSMDPGAIERLSQIWKIPPEAVNKLLRNVEEIKDRITGPKIAQANKEEERYVQRGKKFFHECFNKAADYVIWHQQLNPKLVHGTLKRTDGTRIAHGWALVGDDKVFDGVQQEFYDKGEYYRILDAVEEKVYDYDEMVKLMLRHKHYGPWHDTAGIFNPLKPKKERKKKEPRGGGGDGIDVSMIGSLGG